MRGNNNTMTLTLKSLLLSSMVLIGAFSALPTPASAQTPTCTGFGGAILNINLTCTMANVRPECKNNNQCDPNDISVLNILANSACKPGTAGSLTGCSTAAVQEATQAQSILQASGAANTSCTYATDFFNPICWGRVIGGMISTILIGISGFLLALAGLLFNWTIQYLIVDFNTFVYGGVRGGIDIAWTAFRDIANIVIIGMFTFVAISMILGMEKFGNKKFIAKILLIAVLINFSMLFSRLIIESSHVLAGQFYRAAQSQIGVQNTDGSVPGQIQVGQAILSLSQGGLAGEFIKLMGVPSALDSNSFATKLAKDLNNGWLALLYGLLTALFLLGATLVFLYAAFLLIVRTILLIFLMMTSALAFASFLVPAFGAEKGWSLWWQSLLKSSLLAPLLLMFFWATLVVGKSFVAGSGGSLGTLLSDPTAGSSIKALFFYLFMLGMLFASIKIASSFSSSIAGFNFTTMAVKLGGGIPLALGGRLAGYVGRNTLGRSAALRASSIGDEMSRTRIEQARLERDGRLTPGRREFFIDRIKTLDKQKQKADERANSKFSLANTDLGKSLLTKQLKVPGMIAGGGKNVVSYAESSKKIAEDAAKRASEATTLTATEQRKLREEATAGLSDQRNDLKEEVEMAKLKRQREEERRRPELDQHEQEVATQREERRRTAQAPASAARDAQLETQQVRIETARREIDRIQREITAAVPELARNTRDLTRLEAKIETDGRTAVNNIQKSMNEVGAELAAGFASKSDEYIASKARSTFNKSKRDDAEGGRLLRQLQQQMSRSGGGAPPPAAAPPPATPTP